MLSVEQIESIISEDSRSVEARALDIWNMATTDACRAEDNTERSGWGHAVKVLWRAKGHTGSRAEAALDEMIEAWDGDENGTTADALIADWESSFLGVSPSFE